MRAHEVGSALRVLRKQVGWTLREVAERTGVSIAFLSDVERGECIPSLTMLSKIVAIYGLDVQFRTYEEPCIDDAQYLNGGY